jgi:hypothetical protein
MPKTMTVTFTRTTVATAEIEVPEGFDPTSQTYEEVALDWLDANHDGLVFSHDGCDIEIWNIEKPEPSVRVPAVVVLQRWVYDYAEDVEEVQFDCSAGLDAIPLSDLPDDADKFYDGACNYGDNVYYESVRVRAVKDWNGPFRLSCVDSDAYHDYLASRRG